MPMSPISVMLSLSSIFYSISSIREVPCGDSARDGLNHRRLSKRVDVISSILPIDAHLHGKSQLVGCFSATKRETEKERERGGARWSTFNGANAVT